MAEQGEKGWSISGMSMSGSREYGVGHAEAGAAQPRHELQGMDTAQPTLHCHNTTNLPTHVLIHPTTKLCAAPASVRSSVNPSRFHSLTVLSEEVVASWRTSGLSMHLST